MFINYSNSKKNRTCCFASLILTIVILGFVSVANANYAILRDFVANDGRAPYGSLTLSGNELYGMTSLGGNNKAGVIFKVETNGNNYTILHYFTGDNGSNSYGSLTLSGSNLYGMTRFGGDNDEGVIFKMDIDGANYANIYDFTTSADDGSRPMGSLIISDNSLAGMTNLDGDDDCGVVFRIGLDGANYTNIHEFIGGVNDGSKPAYGSLLEYDGYFYGMTQLGGGVDNYGVIFKQLVPEPTFFGILFVFGGFFLRAKNTWNI